MTDRYQGQGPELPLSPPDLGDDDQPPVEWNRKRGSFQLGIEIAQETERLFAEKSAHDRCRKRAEAGRE